MLAIGLLAEAVAVKVPTVPGVYGAMSRRVWGFAISSSRVLGDFLP